MATGALCVGRGPTVRGGERSALPAYNESLRFFGNLQHSAEVERFEPVADEPHGGDRDKLARVVQRGDLVVERRGVAMVDPGHDLNRLFATSQGLATDLTR